jgi:ornithine carbamoyltransferase
MTDLLAIRDLAASAILEILDRAERPSPGRPLEGKGVALYFQKPSARTRNSMEMAVVQLGGHPVYIQKDEVGLGSRESVADVARTLACYHAIIAARVNDHRLVEGMAAATGRPVVNMLSDSDHPLQALADLLTIRQLCGRIEGVRVAWIGDGNNNVCRSLAEGCSALGAELTIASPQGHGLPETLPGVRQLIDPREAAEGAQFLYTDVWVSMGQDGEAEERRRSFAPYQVGDELMAATAGAWFLHCLPANRGQEVTDAVIDGPRSAVWRQAENRMHSARGALAWLMGQG